MKNLLFAAMIVLAMPLNGLAASVQVVAGAFNMGYLAEIGGHGYQFDRLGALDLSNPMPDDLISGNSDIGFWFGFLGLIDIWTSAPPTLSLSGSDLSGWSWSRDASQATNQGATNVPTVDNGDGTWTMTWNSLFLGDVWYGQTGYWQVMVTAPSDVPEPASLLLIGSGIAGLVGLGRRRK